MSRTLKDMPINIRYHDFKGEPFEDDGSRYSRKWLINCWEDEAYRRFVEGNLLTFSNPAVGKMAREQNRNYRAKCKQLIREGRYDDLPRPRKNARWLVY